MELIHLFRKLAFLQVLLGVCASTMAEQNIGLLLAAGTLAVLSWYVVEGPTGRALPKWVIFIATFAATGHLGYELYQLKGQNLIVTISHYTLWLQIVLLYSQKLNRDYAQLLVLSILQMISACVLGVSLIFGALLVTYCVVALFTILLFQLKVSSDLVHEHNRRSAPAGAPLTRPKPVVGRGFRWQFRWAAVVCGLSCGLFGAAAFLLMPRMQAGQLSQSFVPQLARQQTGFATQIKLGRQVNVNGGDQIVMHARLIDRDKGLLRENDSLLLRGTVMDTYDPISHLWRRTEVTGPSDDVMLDIPPDGFALLELPPSAPVLEATVVLLSTQQRHLFSPDLPLARISNTSESKLVFNPHTRQLRITSNRPGTIMYRLTCATRLPPGVTPLGDFKRRVRPVAAGQRHTLGQRSPGSSRTRRTYARRWSVQTQRIRQLTTRIIDQAGLERDFEALYQSADAQICQALVAYLGDTRRFTYSLDVPPPPVGLDPIVNFLFNTRAGHCELFASAMTAMARSVGLRARMVSGYRTGDFNAIGGYHVVRQKNAHAWMEVEFAPSLWRSFDATPPEIVSAEHVATRTWLTPLHELYEHIEYLWARTVVAYDSDARSKVLADMTRPIRTAGGNRSIWAAVMQWFKDAYDRLTLDIVSQVLVIVITVFILIGLLTLLRILIVRRRRLVALQLTALPRHQRRQLSRQLRFYLTMLDTLERYGYIRPAWQSPFAFARQLADHEPARFDPVVALTELFYEVRFGYRRLDEQRTTAVRTHLSRLEQSLKQKPA